MLNHSSCLPDYPPSAFKSLGKFFITITVACENGISVTKIKRKNF